MKNHNFIIYRNLRVQPNDFRMKYNCDYCADFHDQVITIPMTDKCICKSCLYHLIETMDQNMRDLFQYDFTVARREYEASICKYKKSK